MKEKFYNMNAEIDYGTVLAKIQYEVKEYLTNNKIKTLVIGISGGIDSGLNAALLSPICKELDIKLVGRFLHIESNKKDELERAIKIGNAFCTDFEVINLDELYNAHLKALEEPSIFGKDDEDIVSKKIRRGNIKARMRMTYLYNLSQKINGIVVDNDNMTEYLLGFYTLNGGGDISPLYSLLKTEVYGLAKYYVVHLKNGENDALQSAIDAVPTDGLGITSSDVEQFGTKTYDEVDDILVNYINGNGYEKPLETYLYPKYGKKVVDKVLGRFVNTKFKRNHPYRILI